jgi:hypothetical protein
MTEIKAKEPNNNQVAPPLTRASLKIRLLTNVEAIGDRSSMGTTLVALERGGLNPDMALDGFASGKGLRVLEGNRDNWLPKRDPSQPVSVLEEHGHTLVHTRELLDNPQVEQNTRKFIISVVTAGDAASVGLEDLARAVPSDKEIDLAA